MLSFLLRLLFYFLMSSSVLIAADVPEETLNVSAAPEFRVDLVEAIRPMIEENYTAIQIMVAIYLVMEFYLFPYLDHCEELAKERRYKEELGKKQEWRRQYWEERKAQEAAERERQAEIEREERELDRDAEELTSLENWNYFVDYD